MKLKEIMTPSVVRIHPEETVDVAARMLTHYNIGALPVCDDQGRLVGMITDRDVVIRCVASGHLPEKTHVRDIMTGRVVCGSPEMDTGVAAHLMGREQVRRLPVVEQGRLCGMVSVGDLACIDETNYDAAEALGGICTNLLEK
ncbi:MAG: CBS domain-containing protein [Ruminococcaceae bacterium]|nr:CBS domain-containing protein [Oscillospiraceae bacterium]